MAYNDGVDESVISNRDRLRTTSSHHIESGIRALAENLGEGLVVIQGGQIVFMNEKLTDIVGMSRAELMNRDLESVFPEGVEPRKYIDIRNRRERGEDIEYPPELRFRLASGRVLEMRNRSSLIDWAGQPATVHFLEDITLRKGIERQLSQQQDMNSILTDTVRRILASPLSLEETAGTVLDSALSLTGSRSGVLAVQDGQGRKVLQRRCEGSCEVCTLSATLDRILVNREIMGRSRPGRIEGAFYLNEEIESGAPCLEYPTLKNILRVPARSGGPLKGDIILADAADAFGPWDLDAMEKVAEVLSLALVRLQAVEELKTAKEAAEREAEARSLFLANVSHEIRSPLNGVMMMASLLQDSELSREQREHLGIVMSSARTIDRLLRDLTDLTQIRIGRFTIQDEDFDINELCRGILETNRPDALRKGLSLECTMAPGPARFRGDRERVGQIVSNLLTNAIKYTLQGTVRLDISRKNGILTLDVTDTGTGIPPKHQESVFGLFRQVPKDSGGKPQGTGIGLAVVKELTEVMNGRIHLESQVGRGSRFTVTLPLKDSGSTVVQAKPEPVEEDFGEDARILVAEDEGIIRLYLRTYLQKAGWLVDEAADGLAAVHLAEQFPYRLILMDIDMPRMDGLEATSLIREFRPQVPVVAITGRAYSDDQYRILEAGIDEIAIKPIDDARLDDLINRYLRTS